MSEPAIPTTLHSEAELCELPDGTLISWLRIPTDPTSKAIAFVNHEIEDTGETSSAADLRRVTWVSPGGWDPKSPSEVGVTYPCVALGTLEQLMVDHWAVMRDSMQFATAQSYTYDVGGTSVRSQAVFAAINWCAADRGSRTEEMLAIAVDIEQWLTRDTLAQSMNDAVDAAAAQDYPGDSITQAIYREADEIRHAISVLSNAHHDHGLPVSATFIKRGNDLADALTRRAQDLL